MLKVAVSGSCSHLAVAHAVSSIANQNVAVAPLLGSSSRLEYLGFRE